MGMIITNENPIKKHHQKIVDLYLAGATVTEIAHATDYTPQGVYYVAKRYALERPQEAKNYSQDINDLATWLDVSGRKAELIIQNARKVEETPCPLLRRLSNLGLTPRRHAHAQALFGAKNMAISIFPIPMVMDYGKNKLTKLTWVELVKAISNPIKWMEETR
jgi:hypothetical protein